MKKVIACLVIAALSLWLLAFTSTAVEKKTEYAVLHKSTGVVIMLIKDNLAHYIAGQIVYTTPLYFYTVVIRGDISVNAPIVNDYVVVEDSLYVSGFVSDAHAGALRRVLQSDSIYIDVTFSVPDDTLLYKARFYVPDSLLQKAEKLVEDIM